ncbi:Rieske (2Fe-2S) protein [Streptomyces sp. Z26]|uniref:Rieske (2Fe-2S) protein n=1 Tax=Streptomyces TaxID=1883 RepID=UPI000EF172E8|nr:Rieske (2Fe-2S) protein [Streptomyces sp. Z26]RLL69777.1 Rieske (2Fe-2S) protein [Streptomyces sp. Z26]
MRNPLTKIEELERAEALDRFTEPLRAAVRALPLGPVRDVLHGTWQGHALHPTLVQIPVGTWTSAALLDLRGGNDRAARALVAVGLAAAAPAALSGAVDYAEQLPEHQRVGVVHAAANVTAVALYTASFVARRRPGRGRLLGLAGLTVASAGGFLGGHLAFRQGAGVNHADAVPHLLDPEWYAVGVPADFPAGEPVRRMAGEVPVVLVRDAAADAGNGNGAGGAAAGGGALHALADRCAHLAGPLSGGEVDDGCVTCPWHGSAFRLTDGACVSGPATAPQPAFEVREESGRVEVRLPAAEAAP